MLFMVFLYYTVGELIRQRPEHPTLHDLVASELPGVGPRVTFARDVLVTLSGFGALLYGAARMARGKEGLGNAERVCLLVVAGLVPLAMVAAGQLTLQSMPRR